MQNSLRLLYLPLFTNRNLNGCTSYNTGTRMMRYLIDKYGDFFYWYLPTMATKQWHYDGIPSPVEKDHHVHIHRFPMKNDQYEEARQIPPDFSESFSIFSGEHTLDAILCERTSASGYLNSIMSAWYDKGGTSKRYVPVPIVTRDPFIKTKKLHGVSTMESLMQSVGIYSNYNAFFCDNDMKLAMEEASRYFNPSAIKRIERRSIIVPGGTDTEGIDAKMVGVEKREKLTVLVAERLLNSSDSPLVLEVINYAYSIGYPIDTVITSQTAFGPHVAGHFPHVFEFAEVHESNPRDKYIPLAASCHATLTASKTHSYPQGLMEQLYMGIIAVVPDAPWMKTLLPDYPFKFSMGSVQEAFAMLKWVLENYEEAKQRVAWVPEYIRTHYDSKICIDTLRGFIQEIVDEERSTAKPMRSFVEMVKNLPVNVIDEYELRTLVKDQSRNGITFSDPRKTTSFNTGKSALFQAMRATGWVDTCDTLVPRFVRDPKWQTPEYLLPKSKRHYTLEEEELNEE